MLMPLLLLFPSVFGYPSASGATLEKAQGVWCHYGFLKHLQNYGKSVLVEPHSLVNPKARPGEIGQVEEVFYER
jgi:hypothetical protein